MPGYTLLCGHRFDLNDLVTRAITDEPGRDVCPVCNVQFTTQECCYLAYCDTTKMSLAEWTRLEVKALAKRRAELAANPPKPLMPTCSGICKSGKTCTKSATRASGVYCNLHV